MSRGDSRDQRVSGQVKDQYEEEISLDMSNNGRDFMRKIFVISCEMPWRLQNSREETRDK
jgi:hypothetical protein